MSFKAILILFYENLEKTNQLFKSATSSHTA